MKKFSEQLNNNDFPHTTEKGRIKATIENLDYLLTSYGITCQYDEVLKKQSVILNKENISSDISETATYARIKSLLAFNDIPLSCIDLIPALLEQNSINPVLSWINSEKWDLKKDGDLIGKLLDTLVVAPEYKRYKSCAVVTWLIQCIAAIDSAKQSPIHDKLSKYELVLVLQGEQGIGKTTWFKSLLPSKLKNYFVEGAHLDPADKDSVKKCISSWICELGEVDATFRKTDIARLKAFLSNEYDEIRLPYDRVSSSFRRKTSFCASVNPKEFLTDSTGSRRFLPLEVMACTRHNIDMQKLWAQVWELYISGVPWWCSKELEELLIEQHSKHSETSAISELVSVNFNLDEPIKHYDVQLSFNHLNATQILQNSGVNLPNKDQIKQLKQLLENNQFREVKLNGKRGYWITKDISDKPKKEEPKEEELSIQHLIWRAKAANPVNYREEVDKQIEELKKAKDKKRNTGLKPT
jgi:putative DNA primase/helicase